MGLWLYWCLFTLTLGTFCCCLLSAPTPRPSRKRKREFHNTVKPTENVKEVIIDMPPATDSVQRLHTILQQEEPEDEDWETVL